MRLALFSLLFVLAFSSMTSAHFVCGVVEDSEETYSSWLNVIAYYGEDINDFTSCLVSPEDNKYCCDIEDIRSKGFEPGIEVGAELYDVRTGLIGGPVNLELSEEGFDVFEKMVAEKAIRLTSFRKILVNESLLGLNVSLHKNYNNLRYELDNISNAVCENCLNASFEINLNKGKNEIKLIAYGQREMPLEIEAYSLDYLNLKREFVCEGCKLTGNHFKIPVNKEIKVRLFLNSSHEIKGELIDYYPVLWEGEEHLSASDYSKTHKKISFDIDSKESLNEYNLRTPAYFLPRNYRFLADFEGEKFEDRAFISFFPWWPKGMYWKKGLNEEDNYGFNGKRRFISVSTPSVEKIDDSLIDLVAIYPSEETELEFVEVNEQRNLISNWGSKSYKVSTNIPEGKTEKVVIRFKAPEIEEIEVVQEGNLLDVRLLKVIEGYNYYEFEMNNQEGFSIKSRKPNYFTGKFDVRFSTFRPRIFPDNWGEFRDCFEHLGVICNFRDYFDSSGFFNVISADS